MDFGQPGASMSTPRKRRRISPWWALLLVPIIGGGLAASGVIKAPTSTPSADTASKLETALASQGQFRVSVTGPGTLRAPHDYSLNDGESLEH